MVKTNTDASITERIAKLECTLVTGLRKLEEQLRCSEELNQFFGDALKAHRERCIGKLARPNDPYSFVHAQIRNDPEIRFPHRKILECLASQYDFGTQTFRELHFSKLVKEARLGKNKAKQYLSLLEAKGLIIERTDGYRHFYRIAADT